MEVSNDNVVIVVADDFAERKSHLRFDPHSFFVLSLRPASNNWRERLLLALNRQYTHTRTHTQTYTHTHSLKEGETVREGIYYPQQTVYGPFQSLIWRLDHFVIK